MPVRGRAHASRRAKNPKHEGLPKIQFDFGYAKMLKDEEVITSLTGYDEKTGSIFLVLVRVKGPKDG